MAVSQNCCQFQMRLSDSRSESTSNSVCHILRVGLIFHYRTYFVEYQFPVVAASRDNSERNTSATETVRAVSKKVDKSGGEFMFFLIFTLAVSVSR